MSGTAYGCRTSAFGGYVTLGVTSFDPRWTCVGREQRATASPRCGARALRRGGLEVSLEALSRAVTRVLFDMVNELVCWFQSVGSSRRTLD